MNMHDDGPTLLKKGGRWLGAARNYIQWNLPKGDSVTWGSKQHIDITAFQIEELVAAAVAADRKEQARNNDVAEKSKCYDIIEGHIISLKKEGNSWDIAFKNSDGKRYDAIADNLTDAVKIAAQTIE